MRRLMAMATTLLLALALLPVQVLAAEASSGTDQWGAPLGSVVDDEAPEGYSPEDTMIQSITVGNVNTNITIDQIITFSGRLESSLPGGNHVHLGGEYWIYIEGTQIYDYVIVAASDNGYFGFTSWSEVVEEGLPKFRYVLCLYCDDGYYIEGGITMVCNGKSYRGQVISEYGEYGDNAYIVAFEDFAVEPSHPVPLYRMYNTKTSEHLWTRSKAEYDSCGSGNYRDWKAEGVAWYAPRGGRPVYRLYNLKSGDHHYTTSAGEKASLLASGQWRDEGVAFYSATNKDSNTIKIYRVYNGRLKRGQHHYTKSAAERDSLVKNSGWRDEGIGFYGYSSANPPRSKPVGINEEA